MASSAVRSAGAAVTCKESLAHALTCSVAPRASEHFAEAMLFLRLFEVGRLATRALGLAHALASGAGALVAWGSSALHSWCRAFGRTPAGQSARLLEVDARSAYRAVQL